MGSASPVSGGRPPLELSLGHVSPLSIAASRRRFRAAKPFMHLALDGFVAPALARRLAREMPKPPRDCFKLELNGYGNITRRAVDLGPGFRRLDGMLDSNEFRGWLEATTGIPGLERNRAASCGGLFACGQDSEMDVHLDANRIDFHCTVKNAGRNLLMFLYLNEGWKKDWGGDLELYQDPSKHADRAYSPTFNRMVLVDIHDRSWHAVSRVRLPAREAHRARFVLIESFFSARAKRPLPATRHFNIYRPRALPAQLRSGREFTLSDALIVAGLLARRERRLTELRRLRADSLAARAGRAPATTPVAATADPFALLDLLPPSARPGRLLTRAGLDDLRTMFRKRDLELARLYAGQFKFIATLAKFAPERVPDWVPRGALAG